MPLDEDLELLNAVLALALADGKLTRGEQGIIQGLAGRIGVGQVSLDAMVERAKTDPDMYKELSIADSRKARLAMSLLVAQARVDGEISDEERGMLVKIAMRLGIDTGEFGQIYETAIHKADDLRRRRGAD